MASYSGYYDDLIVYLQYSDQSDVSIQWLKNLLHQTPEKIIKEGTNEIKILSVGSGAGEPDAVILDYILSLGRPVHHTSIEPNVAQMTRFRSNISRNPKYSDVKFVLLEMTSEEFLESHHSKQNFDLIIFFHCMYYLGIDLKPVVKKYYAMAAAGGFLVALTGGKRLGWHSLIDQFAGQIPVSNINTAEDVEAALKENHIHHDKEEIFFNLDIAPLIADEEFGNSLLNFLVHAVDARHTLPRGLLKEIIEYLKTLASEDGDRLIVGSLIGIHLVKKD